MRWIRSLFLPAILLWPVWSHGETMNDALARAAAAVQAATPRAQADPSHPIFHITAPAQWINDPNGPIFYKGFYHLFYQLHPFSDQDGPKYWGHVRSRDLVKWEHLPIALAPSGDGGEEAIWSGCCTMNGRGKPMIFYTSIASGKSPQDHAEQWAATSDDDLIHWRKLPANPALSEALHEGRKIYDWRDPFVFHEGGKTFLVTGGNLNRARGGQAVVNIYEAQNPELTRWKYRGVLFHVPEGATAECPNFFKLKNQWVLFVSPYGRVQYFIGHFNAAACRFEPSTQGLLDYGGNFYAPNTMQVPDGRRLVWGWVNGFPGGHGWNGCLSLPRQLTLTRTGEFRQSPAPQLNKLRGKAVERRNVRLENSSETLALPKTNTLEIRVEIDLQTAKSIAFEIRSDARTAPVNVKFDGSELQVMDAKAPLQQTQGRRRLSLRIFIDRSVLEVFANDTVCVTKVISPLAANATLEMRVDGGVADAKVIDAWPMKTIW